MVPLGLYAVSPLVPPEFQLVTDHFYDFVYSIIFCAIVSYSALILLFDDCTF